MTIHNYRVPINRFKFTKHIKLMMLSHMSEIGICPYCFNYVSGVCDNHIMVGSHQAFSNFNRFPIVWDICNKDI